MLLSFTTTYNWRSYLLLVHKRKWLIAMKRRKIIDFATKKIWRTVGENKTKNGRHCSLLYETFQRMHQRWKRNQSGNIFSINVCDEKSMHLSKRNAKAFMYFGLKIECRSLFPWVQLLLKLKPCICLMPFKKTGLKVGFKSQLKK